MNDKVIENRIRRALHRRGLALKKSRRRDPHAIGYGTYAVIDPQINACVSSNGLTLEDVDDWMNK